MNFVNTQYFREPALYFQKYGRYEDGEYLSYEWYDYWERERDRLKNGYTVGDTTITGEHYQYLNYSNILINEETTKDEAVRKRKGKKKARRKQGFADFWDEDYILFWTWYIAKEGVPKITINEDGNTRLSDCDTFEEALKWLDHLSKDLTIPIVREDENLVGGKNHLWLKPRNVGASWKGATRGANNLYFKEQSKTFYVAHESKYLTEDGILNKFVFVKNFIQENCSGLVTPFLKQNLQELTYRAGYKENVDGNIIEKGLLSEVIGFSINGVPDNVRGKRGDIIYEEFGTFPKVAATWEVAQQSVEQDGIVYGTQYGFGTGGDENSTNIQDLTTMFSDPDTYNLLKFLNKYDKDLYDTECAYFTPAYRSLSFKDKDGNSNEEEAKKFQNAQREIKKAASDPRALTSYCAEKPHTPTEALMTAHGNIFPVMEIRAHRVMLETTKRHRDLIVTGRFEETLTGVKFNKTDEPPFEDYPIRKNTVQDSPVCIRYPPFRRNGQLISNMYRACLDPYRNDSSTGDSVGAFYIIENPNKYTIYKGNRIVAWYVARPDEQEDFVKTCYQMLEYYGCKVGIENDETGDFISYGKRHKLLQRYVEGEFELAYDERIKTKNVSVNKFGMHISSGQNDLRKLQGDMYIKSWLNTPVGFDKVTGKQLKVLHTIDDIGLLKELEQYPKGNFDRISALRIGMYYEKELIQKNITTEQKQRTRDKFFTQQLYQ